VVVKTSGGNKYTKASSLVFTFSGLASDASTSRKLYLKASNGDLTLLQGTVDGDDVTVTGTHFDSDGTYTVVGKIEDHAGNESASSSDLTFTVDRTPPAKPTVVVHGAVTATPTFRVSGVEAGAVVFIYSKASNGDLTEIGKGTSTGTTIDITATSSLSTGANTVVVKSVDIAGNESVVSSDLGVTVKAVTLAFDYEGDHIWTQDGTPTIRFKGLKSGDRVNVYLSSDTLFRKVIGTGVVGAGLTTLGVVLDEGGHSFSEGGPYAIVAKAVNGEGVESDVTSSLSVTVDRTLPSRPIILGVEGATGDGQPYFTNDATPTVLLKANAAKGNFEDGLTVRIYLSLASDPSSREILGSTVVKGVGVKEVKVVLRELGEDSYGLGVEAEDRAGNKVGGFRDEVLEVDLTPPSKPTVTISSSTVKDGKTITTDSRPSFTVVSDSFERYLLYVKGREDEGEHIAGSFAGNGKSAIISVPIFLLNGEHIFVVKLIDSAKNETLSDDIRFTVLSPPGVLHSTENPLVLDVEGKKLVATFDQKISSFDGSKVLVYYDEDGVGSDVRSKGLLTLTTDYSVSVVGGKLEIALKKSGTLVEGSEYSVKFEAGGVTDIEGVKNVLLSERLATTDVRRPFFGEDPVKFDKDTRTITVVMDEDIRMVEGFSEKGIKITFRSPGGRLESLSEFGGISSMRASGKELEIVLRSFNELYSGSYTIDIFGRLIEDLSGNDFLGGTIKKEVVFESFIEEDVLGLGVSSDAEYGF
jgi:hypothetical protein